MPIKLIYVTLINEFHCIYLAIHTYLYFKIRFSTFLLCSINMYKILQNWYDYTVQSPKSG